MLTERELATLRAALRFWQEEMGPSGPEAMRPYLEPRDLEPLSTDELEELRALLAPEAVRYALYDAAAQRLASPELYPFPSEAFAAAGQETPLAVVLLPAGFSGW